MTVRQIHALIDTIAPFDTQEAFDNSGLLVGSPETEITGILIAMDVTSRVLDEAESLQCNLLITHHPMMFHARKTLNESDPESRLLAHMIRSGTCLIAAHTNLDRAPGGINDALARRCRLTEITGEGFVRFGHLVPSLSLPELVSFLSQELRTTVRVLGSPDCSSQISRIVVSSGAGSEMWPYALQQNAQVFLTGEIRHHDALAMNEEGIIGLECGHFATEEPGLFALKSALQSDQLIVESNIRVCVSQVGAYAMPKT